MCNGGVVAMAFERMTQNEIIEYLLKENAKLKKENTSQRNEIEQLKVEYRDLQIEFNKKLKELEDKEIIIKKFLKDKYYTTSEKMPDKPKNLALNEAEVIYDEAKRAGRKAGGKNANNKIPTEGLEEVTIDFTEEEFQELSKSHELVRFGEDICVKLVKQPAVYSYVKFIHPKYRDKNHPDQIFQSEITDAFKKTIITASVASDIINNKINLGVPLERQAQYHQSNGLDISAQDLSNYALKSAEILTPVYDKMKEALVNNSAQSIHVDETTVQVLGVDEREKSYMYVSTTSFWNRPILIYDFSLDRTTTEFEVMIENYDGFITVDGYGGYDKFKENGEKPLKGVQMCWAHLRRYWVNADPEMLSKKRKRNKETEAEKMVHLIDKVFQKEKQFKNRKLTMDEIKAERNKPEFLKLLDEIYKKASSIDTFGQAKLEEAKNYTLKHWNEFKTFLKYGGLDITNSIAERAVRPFAVARNSFLFCKSERGAKATGILFSIVQTARANGLSVEKYLNYVFNNISTKTASDLLPWSESIPQGIRMKLN